MKKLSQASVILLLITACSTTPVQRDPASFWDRSMSESDILKAASSNEVRFSSARIIIDNDAAFDAKLKAIKEAQSGDTLRVAYYILSDDYSSSVFLDELLKAAQRGVRVKLLLDFLTNYHQHDLLTYLQKKSNGQIDIRFYGKPSQLIVRDSLFLTQPCPNYQGTPSATYCSDSKWNEINKNKEFVSTDTMKDPFAKMLLTGIYTKNANLIKTSLLIGAQIDPKSYQNTSPADPKEQEQLKKFLKSVYEAKVKGDITARIKVAMALMMYGDQLKPLMNEISGRIPLSQMGEKSAQHWEHLADFLHHKIIMRNDSYLVLGGRNIEDSYHMKPNKLTKKYIFMDTDFAAEIRSGGNSIAKSFDQLFEFSPMVMSLTEASELMPFDYVANSNLFLTKLSECSGLPNKTKEDRVQVASCLGSYKTLKGFKTLSERHLNIENNIKERASVYKKTYLPTKKYSQSWKPGTVYDDQLSGQEINSTFGAYLENLHYNKKQKAERIFGSTNGKEIPTGKNIHHIWVKGLVNACNQKTPQRVILHSAYWIPPANLYRTFRKMMDGTWDCSNVKVQIITNSFETTDLNIINIFAKYQTRALFETYKERLKISRTSQNKSATFEYYEYNPSTEASGLSLHSKVSVLGDDLIIGSANGDVRSYYMDTNNAIFIRGAKDSVQAYIQYIDGLIKDQKTLKNLTSYYQSSETEFKKMIARDNQLLDYMISKYKFLQKASPNTIQTARSVYQSLVKEVYEISLMIMDRDYIDAVIPITTGAERRKLQNQQRKENYFNHLLMLQ